MALINQAQTTPKRLKYWAEENPDLEAIVCVGNNVPRTSFSRLELYESSKQFGRNLLHIGIKPGSVVCSVLPESPANIVAFFGIHFAGCVVQNGTIHLNDAKFLIQNLNASKCRVLILPSDSTHQGNKILSSYLDETNGHRVSSATLPYLQYIIYAKSLTEQIGFIWEDVSESTTKFDEINIKEDDSAMIVVSSGSSGISKLILYSHFSIFRLGEVAFLNTFETELGDAIFDSHPINWGWGLPFWYLITGCKRVMIDQRFPPADAEYHIFVRDIILSEKCRFAKLSVATCLRIEEIGLPETIKNSDQLWSLQTVFVSGQPLKKNMKLLKIIGSIVERIYNVYGLSEMGVVSTKLIDKDTKFEEFNAGLPGKGIEVLIVDNDMKPVSADQYGQLLIKNQGFFKGYIDNEALNKSSFTKDGFFCTNDYACLTESGEIIIRGRYSDVIMRGENYFHPSWIGDIIRECPYVADVVVVKVPDEALFNEICACFIREKGSSIEAKDVEYFCKQRFINQNSNDKTAYPRYYLLLESLPVNRNGKYDIIKLEKIAANLLNLGE